MPTPLTDQAMDGFVAPITVALNDWFPPAVTVAVLGAIETLIGGRTVTVADPDFAGSAWETAVTVTVTEGTAFGAVYLPFASIAPMVVGLPPVMPFTCQTTAVLEVPVTFAVNCWLALTLTEAVAGETETVIVGGGVTVPPPLPPHPKMNKNVASATKARTFSCAFITFSPSEVS